MTKFKKSDARPASDWIDALPKERKAKIEAGAAKIIRHVHLAELRKAMSVTQTTLSSKSGMKQAEISRIENNPESVQLKTMERYVRSLGGEFKIIAQFPDGTLAEIPLHGGKPVKSRITVEDSKDNQASDNRAEARLRA